MANMSSHPFAGGTWKAAFGLLRGPQYQAYADSILFTPSAAGGGITHVVGAAVLAFAGQGVTSSAATLHVASPASMAMAGQAVGSANAIVHTVTAATMGYAGQAVASIAAVIHAVTAAVKAFAGQTMQSVTPVSHAVAPASEIHSGQEVGGSGVASATNPVTPRSFGKRFGYRWS